MHKRKVHFTGTRDHWIQFWLEGIVIAKKGEAMKWEIILTKDITE
jgi:hypothetical protein